MKKRKVFFLLIVLLLFSCACLLGACSKEKAVMQPNDSTEPSNSTKPDSSIAPENSSVEPYSGAADKNTLPDESPSPEPKSDENESKTDAEEPLTWQSAYVEIICHVEDYLAPVVSSPYEGNERENLKLYNPNNKDGYVGIHDFDGDDIPELLAGDDLGIGVFTFAEGKAEKLADLYWPDIVWCINGVYVKDNGLRVSCSGSTGSWNVCFGFVEGEYRLGRYYYYAENAGVTGSLFSDATLNGEPCTREEMDKIYNTYRDEHDYKTEYKERLRIINKDGT